MSAKPFELQPMQGGKVGLLAVFTAKRWGEAVKISEKLGAYPSHSHKLIEENPEGLQYGVYLRKQENTDQFYYYISIVPLLSGYADFENGEKPLFAELPEIRSRKGILPLDEGRALARKIREKGATHE